MEKLQPYEGQEPYIFISYARKDTNRVFPFLQALQQSDYRFWYDGGVTPGDEWNDVIATHVVKCTAFLAFVSTVSQDSKYCNREITNADFNNKPLVSFWLDEKKNIHLQPGTAFILQTFQALNQSEYSPKSLPEELARHPAFQSCKGLSEEERQEAERIQQEQREADRQELERLKERIAYLEAEFQRQRVRQERERREREPQSPKSWKSPALRTSEPFSPPLRYNIVDEMGDIRFTITSNDLIGYGKYSQVYKGELVGSGRTVAVKVHTRPLLRPTRQQQDGFFKARRKVEWLRDLKHPGIAEFIDWFPDFQNNRSFIVMQYIEGRGLNRELADKGPFRQARVLNWALQLLNAMEYLHSKHYILGALDPSKIVLKPEDTVCLVDFKYLSDIRDTFREGVKYRGKYPDTPEGNQALEYGKREDIRCLGATLFELLTGQKPEDLTPEQWEEALSESGVSDSVSDVILKAMSPESEERYASAAEMTRALHDLPARYVAQTLQMPLLIAAIILSMVMFFMGFTSYITGTTQTAYEAGKTVYAEGASESFSDTPSTEMRRDSDTIPNEEPST